MIAFVEDRLPAEALAVPLARHALDVALVTELSEADRDTVLLLATEAVSHAVRIVTVSWGLRVDLTDTTVRVAVNYERTPIDIDSVVLTQAKDDLRASMFDALSSDWGVELEDTEATLWFEVPRSTGTPVRRRPMS